MRNMQQIVLFIFLFFSFSVTFAQLKIATTEDGRRVLLKDDNTWEYIDQEAKKNEDKLDKSVECNLPENFKEPEGEKKIQNFLKRIDATTDDLKMHVAVDNSCSIDKVKLIDISEQKGNGVYVLCVQGKKMKYRRTGSVFNRMGENPIGNN